VARRRGVVSFLSDYGTRDEFVGVCKAVMHSIADPLVIIDVTHEVPPYDVRAGALTLMRSAQYLPSGVVLAIVDPGVGTDRRAVAVEVEGGVLVGPDNGLLAPTAAMLGGPKRVVAIENPEWRLEAPGPTFAGRDVFAPAAARLADGLDLGALGPEVDPATLVPGLVPLPQEVPGGVRGEVWWIDRYGNCQLNVDPQQLERLGARRGGTVEVRTVASAAMARWVHTYAEARPLELVLVVDSYGLVSLAFDRASAAEALGLRPGSEVTLAVEPRAEEGRG
jgi:S-adenosylmethionine hydrolase